MIIEQTQAPAYEVAKLMIVDGEGKPVLDQYGHYQYEYDYSAFPDVIRNCPVCLAKYKFKVPALIAAGEATKIGVNDLGIGFNCPNCGMTIVVCAGSNYTYEDIAVES